jgi:hypothetical protein
MIVKIIGEHGIRGKNKKSTVGRGGEGERINSNKNYASSPQDF